MSPFSENGIVWKNGRLIPWRDATIHLASHVVHYGSCLFEGLRAYVPGQALDDLAVGPALLRDGGDADPEGIRAGLLDARRLGARLDLDREDAGRAPHALSLRTVRYLSKSSWSSLRVMT